MHPRLARRLAAIALASGVAADLLFDRTGLGINVPISILVALVAATLVRPRGAIDPLDAWLPPVALLAALGVAVRSDPLVVLLDLALAGLATLAWTLAISIGGITRRGVLALVALGTMASVLVGIGAVNVLAVLGRDRPSPRGSGTRARLLPVVRGLLIALPILAVFTLLLGSADAAFRHLVGDILRLPLDAEELLRRGTVIIVAAWFVAGGLVVAATGLPEGFGDAAIGPAGAAAGGDPGSPGDPDATDGSGRQGAVGAPLAAGGPDVGPAAAIQSRTAMGSTEALTVLVAVEILFATFVVIQVAYLFGGFATVTSFGVTYSHYAREGFFQLVAVVLGSGLLLAGASAVARHSRWFVPAALGLVALTGVILASAAVRLGLYQQAYGWTELRFYVAAAIVWLGLALLIALGLLLARRIRWLIHGAAFAAIAAALAVTAIGPQAFITRENVARVLDPSLVPAEGEAGLDVGYLSSFGDGAVPVLVDALPRLDADNRAQVLAALQRRRDALHRQDPSGSGAWPAWNLAREQARQALEQLPAR